MTNIIKLEVGEVEVSRGTAKAVADQVEEVFLFWREILSDPRARLDQERRKKINERLKDGYTAEDLKLACIGCHLSDWHARGMNDRHTPYKDIELICRNAKNVDKFREIAEREAHRIFAERQRAEERAAAERQAPQHTPRAPVSDETRAKLDALMASMKVRKKA